MSILPMYQLVLSHERDIKHWTKKKKRLFGCVECHLCWKTYVQRPFVCTVCRFCMKEFNLFLFLLLYCTYVYILTMSNIIVLI